MTTYITKYAAKQLLGKTMDKQKHKKAWQDDDPFFTYIDHPRKPGKKKKVKRQVPDYIPEHDAIILAKMRRRAYWLDVSLFEFAGQRFGWSSVIGIVPGFGDALDAFLAALLVWRCWQVEGHLPLTVLIPMVINVFLDFIIGLVPILGDIGDAWFRANTKNLRLLETHLDSKYKPSALRDEHKKLPKDQRPPPATEYEYFEDDEEPMLPKHRQDTDGLAYPEPAHGRGAAQPDTRRSDTKKSKKAKRGNEDRDGVVYAKPADNDPRRQKGDAARTSR